MLRSRERDDDTLVAEAMRELATTPQEASRLPDPSFIWWKAQFLRRLDAEREATAPLEVGDRMHIGAAVLGAAALGIGAWNHLPTLTVSLETGMTIAASFAVLLTIAAIAALDALRQR